MNRGMAFRWLVVLAVVCGACSVPAEQDAQARDDDAVPFGLLEPDVPPLLPPPTGPATETVSVCFVEGNALSVVDVALNPPVELRDVVDALAEPPDLGDRSLRTAVSNDPPLLRDVRLAAGVAHVDLLPAVTSLGADEQLLLIAQVVCALTGRPGVGPVSFTLEGSPVDVPRGDGSLTSGPVSRDDFAELLV